MKFRLVLVVPYVDEKNILNFVDSLININSIKCLVILVDMLAEPLHLEFNSENITMVKLNKFEKFNSSESRNIGLKYLQDKDIDYDFLMFPDDDTTFDESFHKNFEHLVLGNYLLNLRCEKTLAKYANYKKKNLTAAGYQDVFFVGCVRFLFTRKLIEKVGLFDEKLGIGAQFGAGEDGDFFLRALQIEEIVYLEELYTIHPGPSLKYSKLSISDLNMRFKNYANGVIYMLIKHGLYRESIKIILKSFLAIFYYTLKFNFKMSFIYILVFFQRLKYFITHLRNKKVCNI